MLLHCDKVLQIALNKVILPKTNPVILGIGILTKIEMKIFNNGIPPNMPTYGILIVKENCNFEQCRTDLLRTIDEFLFFSKQNKLPQRHMLFGEMSAKDWGRMEYKHLNHHLKQFGL